MSIQEHTHRSIGYQLWTSYIGIGTIGTEEAIAGRTPPKCLGLRGVGGLYGFGVMYGVAFKQL